MMKATSIFGGVQVFNILISVIRSKLIAVLLGPAGMGIAGLLTSTAGLITSLTNFGLSTSAVKDIATAAASGNQTRIAIVFKVFKRLTWITGLLGLLVTLILSPWLSQITFGNKAYTIAFACISVTLLLGQLSGGQMILLQGMRKLQLLAKANIAGSILGLIVTVPLYYFMGVRGIVPAIIIAAVSTLALSFYFSNKLEVKNIRVSAIRTIAEGKSMLYMGFMISLSGLMTMGASYLVRIYISNTGGVADVGLYNAGFSIIITYVGMIFTAMGTDYYPRLAAVANNNTESSKVINQQAEIAVLIIAPVILVFLVYINWVIVLMYSTKFVPVNQMILYAAFGMFFKAVSWAIAFIFLAKGAKKLYFWNELITNIYLLLFNIIGYKFWGLTGLGVSFMLAYVLYMIQVFAIAKLKYKFAFEAAFYKIFAIQLSLAVACFLTVKLTASPYSYIAGTIIVLFSCACSFIELDKRLGIKSILTSLKAK